MPSPPFNILVVDDNPGDARLVSEAFRNGGDPVVIHHVVDGVEALAFLRRQGLYHQAPRPALVMLDLNLPRKSGREVLAEVKSDPALLAIPVIVLSTSDAAADVRWSYEHHANCYLAKPLDFERFLDMVRMIKELWLSMAHLPV